MNQKVVDGYIKRMSYGDMPPTIGFIIDAETFVKFTEAALIGVLPKYGWSKYKQYMDTWWIKVNKRTWPTEL